MNRTMQAWIETRKQQGSLDLNYLLVWFMLAVYPLVVIPNEVSFSFPMLQTGFIVPPSYFYFPRYVILTLVAMLALFTLIKRPPSLQRRPEHIPLAVFVFFSCLATALAAFPKTAWFGTPMRWSGLTVYLYCILLFLLVAHTLKQKEINWLLKSGVMAAAVVALLAVLQYYGLNLVPHEEFRKNFISYGTMANPNFLGTYMVFMLPAAILIFLYQQRTWFYLLCSALVYAGLLVSLTRGVWLTGLLVFLLLAWYVFFGAGRRLSPVMTVPTAAGGNRLNHWFSQLSGRKAFLILSLVFVLVTLILVPSRDGRLLGKAATMPGEMIAATQLDQEAGSQRVFIWEQTARLWLVNPDIMMFGIGPDHLIYAQIITPGKSLVDKAHNIYLEIAVTLGGFALVAYLLFLVMVLRKADYKKGTTFLLQSMLFAYLVQGLFNVEVIMTMPLFWIVLGMIVACKYKEEGVQC